MFWGVPARHRGKGYKSLIIFQVNKAVSSFSGHLRLTLPLTHPRYVLIPGQTVPRPSTRAYEGTWPSATAQEAAQTPGLGCCLHSSMAGARGCSSPPKSCCVRSYNSRLLRSSGSFGGNLIHSPVGRPLNYVVRHSLVSSEKLVVCSGGQSSGFAPGDLSRDGNSAHYVVINR